MTALHIHFAESGSVGALLLDAVTDAVLDALKTLPFLFAAFLIIELLEHHAGEKINRFFLRSGKAGPLAAALLGCIPQCGFSVLCANLYSGGILTLGTLIAVFISTSDEAVILLAANPQRGGDILRLLLVKVIIALLAGYGIDLLHRKQIQQNPDKLKDICGHEHCGCHEHKGVWLPALLHTAKIFVFVLLFTVLLNGAVALLGEARIAHLLLTDSIWQPFLTAIFGFLPNCAASVLLTQLYLEGAVGFGAVIAGLCTAAGTGLLVLFRENRNIKDNLKIMGILYVVGVASGVLLQVLGIG